MQRPGVAALGDRQVERLGAVCSTLARVVSKCVLLGTTLPGPPSTREEDPLRRPALVGGDHVLEREELLHRLEEAEPRRRAGVALVAVLDAAHWSRDIAPVPESVRRSISTSVAWQLEEVEVDSSQRPARSSSVVSRSGSTEWIRNGSMIVLKLKPS